MNKHELLKEISIKIMSGLPLTPEEEIEWDNWRKQEHIRQYLALRAADRWERFRQIEVEPWDEFCQRMGIDVQEEVTNKTAIAWKKWVAVAAIILFCFVTGWYLLYNWHNQTPMPVSEKAVRLVLPDHREIALDVHHPYPSIEYENVRICLSDSGQICFRKKENNRTDTGIFRVITPAGKTFRVLLSDSSLITLNNRSELLLSSNYEQANRKLELKGEAFFNVKPNPSLPFVVKMRHTEQEVTGTTFLISGYGNDPVITTTLYTGGLIIRTGGNQVVLKDSQQVVIDPLNHSIRMIHRPDLENAGAWRSDFFSSRKTRILLTDLLRKIERWYDIKIIYDDNITNESLTIGRISRKMPADSVLNLLKGPGAFDFIKKDDGYHIRYSHQP